MSITERLRRLTRRPAKLPSLERPRDLPPVSLTRELGRPAAGTMAVQPLYCPDSSGGGYC
ncbi:hypothetical protein [Krasilnikoviella flava]|uniref:Uncharacterized protein n=1 Tax=Krasilnikoviella flava TaxID=526729 RepID=A0A1T5IG28_9MICO|nr:hypothetical protein [Krasilnikoviella flava]SKC38097.1 hypothetical protein SAMN04324258_0475 [Krasilnikoviella flava]